MILVDSSIWVLHQRGALDLSANVPLGEIATCPPVVQEILQGLSNPVIYEVMREALMEAHMLEDPMPLAVFEEAARLYLRCRSAGFTIRSSHDCLIAVCAIRNDVPLLHDDRDFDAIARVSALRFAS